MKFTVDIELEYFEASDDELNLKEAIKREILREISNDLGKKVSKQLINETTNEEFFKEIKKAFEDEIDELRKIPRDLASETKKVIKEVFDAFLLKKAVKITEYGTVKEETTIEALIGERMAEYQKDYRNIINSIIRDKLKAVELNKDDIRKMIQEQAYEISKQNAVKVTEFLINGLPKGN
jgi:hypothetical protein